MATGRNRTDRNDRSNLSEAGDNPGRIRELGPGGADVVRQATDVLESELATGLGAAERAQRRFREERRVDPADLSEALSRFREDGHAVIELARNLSSELRSEATGELAQRLFKDADRALDLALGMVEMAPDMLTRLAELAQPQGGTRPQEGVQREGGVGPAVASQVPTNPVEKVAPTPSGARRPAAKRSPRGGGRR